ncbi:MAG: hypothetical protein H6739_07760 [Alphaproteobacteria bacterium]|nr:hypothetical protein [Alphaproteobacteria bacterium]
MSDASSREALPTSDAAALVAGQDFHSPDRGNGPEADGPAAVPLQLGAPGGRQDDRGGGPVTEPPGSPPHPIPRAPAIAEALDDLEYARASVAWWGDTLYGSVSAVPLGQDKPSILKTDDLVARLDLLDEAVARLRALVRAELADRQPDPCPRERWQTEGAYAIAGLPDEHRWLPEEARVFPVRVASAEVCGAAWALEYAVDQEPLVAVRFGKGDRPDGLVLIATDPGLARECWDLLGEVLAGRIKET